jgi:glycosyltransferase involved in cell wall biosynthesis
MVYGIPDGESDMPMIQLSVVFITRNQAWNVRRLVESVLSQASPFLSIEIVLIDSASTDETVEIACEYPITVISLDADQRLTAAAGRHVGYQHVTGRFILFLDGDMELYPGWLEQALNLLIEHPQIAAITGTLIDRPKATPSRHTLLIPLRVDPVVPRDVKHGGGAAIYRQSVLEEVGSFNPYLYSDEEPDLCIRIRHRGYRVVQLDHPIAMHYTDPDGHLSTLIARWRRRLYLGAGQNLRYHLWSEIFLPYLKERGFGLAPAAALIAGILCLVISVETRNPLWFGAWCFAFIAAIGLDTLRKHSLHRAIYSLLLRLLILDGTIKGFFMRPLTAENSPLKFDIIKRAETAQERAEGTHISQITL